MIHGLKMTFTIRYRPESTQHQNQVDYELWRINITSKLHRAKRTERKVPKRPQSLQQGKDLGRVHGQKSTEEVYEGVEKPRESERKAKRGMRKSKKASRSYRRRWRMVRFPFNRRSWCKAYAEQTQHRKVLQAKPGRNKNEIRWNQYKP